MQKPSAESGELNPLVVVTVVLSLLVVGLASFGIWAYINYNDQKNNVDAKIASAVSLAKKQQSDDDELKFAEREKQPTRQFVGPDDLGRIQFNYPKTWSVYVDKDGKGGNPYDAYLQPGVVPPISSQTPYAVRVSVTSTAYEQTLASYQENVKKGLLRSSPVTIQGQDGTRLDGKFSQTVDGVMVLFKVRDKTLRVFTESRSFQSDYENIVLPSLIFNR